MCLTLVTYTYDPILDKDGVGYKIVRLHRHWKDSLAMLKEVGRDITRFEGKDYGPKPTGFHFSCVPGVKQPGNKWLKRSGGQLVAATGEPYSCGFHLFVSFDQAVEAYEETGFGGMRIFNYWDVVEVKYRGILAMGLEGTRECLIADQILVEVP